MLKIEGKNTKSESKSMKKSEISEDLNGDFHQNALFSA
jgi:hypothetical protein